MFSTKLTRAAHRASATCPCSVTATSTAPPSLAAVSSRRSHQRRPSSSKASCPPDSTTGGKPAPAAKAADAGADAGEDGSSVAARTAVQRSSNKGRSRSGGFKRLHAQHANKLAEEPVNQFAGLPSVPSIQNLNASDLGLSSFFSLHRPLSLANPIPPPSTPEAFNTIFSRPEQDVWRNGNSAKGRPEDIIITLQHTIDSLEGSQNQEDSEGIRWEIVFHGETDIKHLDGPPKLKSLDELVAQFRPFRTPPPPVPFRDEEESARREKPKRTRKTRQAQTSTGQSATPETGAASAEIQEPQLQHAIREPTRGVRRPFLERMRRRRLAYLSKQFANPHSFHAMMRRLPNAAIRQERVRGQMGKMQLISVKRQRKLKMKKHKYKKLMKRTRNLRRRLDRA